jgi:hypothetical protein
MLLQTVISESAWRWSIQFEACSLLGIYLVTKLVLCETEKFCNRYHEILSSNLNVQSDQTILRTTPHNNKRTFWVYLHMTAHDIYTLVTMVTCEAGDTPSWKLPARCPAHAKVTDWPILTLLAPFAKVKEQFLATVLQLLRHAFSS